jgi:hypothetical protein
MSVERFLKSTPTTCKMNIGYNKVYSYWTFPEWNRLDSNED